MTCVCMWLVPCTWVKRTYSIFTGKFQGESGIKPVFFLVCGGPFYLKETSKPFIFQVPLVKFYRRVITVMLLSALVFAATVYSFLSEELLCKSRITVGVVSMWQILVDYRCGLCAGRLDISLTEARVISEEGTLIEKTP